MIAVLDDDRTIIDHVGPWTEDDYFSLSPGGSRIELVDGGLLVSPAPSLSHQRICMRLAHRLGLCGPEGTEALEGVNLRVGPGRLLIPDVLLTFEQQDDLVCAASRVVLVAEVVSPANTGPRWREKHELYAAAGIPWFLIVEREITGQVGLVLSALEGDGYVDQAKTVPGEPLRIPGFRGPLDAADLLKPVA